MLHQVLLVIYSVLAGNTCPAASKSQLHIHAANVLDVPGLTFPVSGEESAGGGAFGLV